MKKQKTKLTKREKIEEEKDKDIWWQDSKRSGKKAIAIIVVLIFFLIAAGLASVFFSQKNNLSQKEIEKMKAELELTRKNNQADLDLLREKLDAAQKELNQDEEIKNQKIIIEGSLGYPGSFIPEDMTICAEKIGNTNNQICTQKHITDKKYKYGVGYKLEVAPGDYNVYATVLTWQGYRAYYSDFVTCGLKYSCASHEPINIKAEGGKNLEGIDPTDWYKQ